MEITSAGYIAFVAVSLFVYWHIAHKYQWYVLLIDSLIFYFQNARPYTIVYLLISVVTVYGATRYFEKNGDRSKLVLIITLIVNIGMLVLLKYTNLFIDTINYIGNREIPTVSWYASLAISFYTLQIVSYLLDCYWKVEPVEKNPLKLYLFTSFFPLMVSGPISSHSQLAPQLFQEHQFDYDRVTSALRRIAWGIAKKVVVADRLSVVVAYMFSNPDLFPGVWVLIAALLFVIELYFDFSGCMDIVIGVSKCFGIELVENFNSPFLSRSIQEIWQRWHITLGGWLKAYVMYPLLKSSALINLGEFCKKRFGKKHGKKIPSYIAMLVVWLLMGIWHGNSWKYVVGEGLWFWAVIVLGQILDPAFTKLKQFLHIRDENIIWKAFQVCRTLVLFSIGMIFFNAMDLQSAFYMIGKMFTDTHMMDSLHNLHMGVWREFGGRYAFLAMCIIGILQIFVDIKKYKNENPQEVMLHMPVLMRWILYTGFMYIIVLEGRFGKSAFIYFGF